MKPLLIFLMIPMLMYGQADTSYRHSIAIDPFALFVQTISVTYGYRINAKQELTFNPKLQFGMPFSNHSGLIIIQNPPYYYDAATMRVGIRTYLKGGWYVEPIACFKSGDFKNRVLVLEDHDGSSSDKIYRMNRTYGSGGFIFKCGWMQQRRFEIRNFYFGMGFAYRWLEELRLTRFYYNGSEVPIDSPQTTKHHQGVFSLHAGLDIRLPIGRKAEY